MVLKKWENLPQDMQCPEVRRYYDKLQEHRIGIVCKRFFDFSMALVLLFFLAIPMMIIALLIALDSSGGVFYRQERVTMYGGKFKIHKFRTMVANADKIGTQVTVGNDSRITKIGKFLRRYRLDELPQLLDIIQGTMSFVGTRPEVPKYVKEYTNEMKATLLLPAGITSEASIRYKDEDTLLNAADDVDKIYIEKVLPGKMKYNLCAIENFSFWGEIMTMIRTVFAVLGWKFT